MVSDASASIFPNNRIGSFRVKLPKKLELDRQRHQIGLSFISWPNKLQNISDGTFRIRGILPNATEEVMSHDGALITAITRHGETETRPAAIQAGYYKSPKGVIDAINNQIIANRFRTPEFRHNPTCAKFSELKYDTTSELVSFKPTSHESPIASPCTVSLKLSGELYTKLGFGLTLSDSSWIRTDTVAPHTADLTLGKNAIFCFCDVIEENRILGNIIGPLLAVVPFQGIHGQTTYFEPKSIEYCDLRYDSITEIKIDLVDDTGQILKFTSGKVIITLHIKDKF